MSEDNTYAPKSPDLSALDAGPPPASLTTTPTSRPHPQTHQTLSQLHSPHAHTPQQQHQLHLQPPQTFQYYPPQSPGSAPHPQPHQPHIPAAVPYSPQAFSQQPQQQDASLQQQYPISTAQLPGYSPHPAHSPGYGAFPEQAQHQYPIYSSDPRYPPSAAPQTYSHPQVYIPASAYPKSQDQIEGNHQTDTMPRRSAAQAAQASPAIAPSPVRTKFPTARIKRIMQADEEVGKVAQQTPIAVGKALEMFMVALVTKSAEVAREKNSKRVTAQMLKSVVESDDQWDFLRDIVGRVDTEEKANKGGRAKLESDSDDDLADVKKKGKGGRKKKV